MRNLLVAAVVSALVVLGTASAHAATETQKQNAIDAALAHLASIQKSDGRWDHGDDNYDAAATGAALYAFLEEGYSAGTNAVINGTDYGDVVGDGLSYLFSRASTYNIFNEPTGNPDIDGNGVGVKFVPGGTIWDGTNSNHNRDTYVTGLVATAIAATGTPNTVVTTGPLAVRTDGSGPGGAWTYGDVMQNALDYFAYGQADPGNWARGGWRYYADYGQADNSTSQWPIIAHFVSQAKSMGAALPSTPTYLDVKGELKHWIDYIQNETDGGSYYDSNFSGWGSNMSRTGALLIEMAYAGYPGSTAADTDPGTSLTENDRYQAALSYINTNWKSTDSYWNGNFGHPYAMWAVYKGLQSTIGLGDTSNITNLHTFNPATMELDPGDTWNWWEDYCEWLVDNQLANGSWDGYTGYSYWLDPLATAWNVNILAATEVAPPVIPEPVTMAGLALGLGGLITYVRRRRR